MGHPSDKATLAKISLRFWGNEVLVRSVLRSAGIPVAHERDVHRAGRSEHFATTTDVTADSVTALLAEVGRLYAMISRAPELIDCLRQHTIEAVIWVAVFGDDRTYKEELRQAASRNAAVADVGLFYESYPGGPDADPHGEYLRTTAGGSGR